MLSPQELLRAGLNLTDDMDEATKIRKLIECIASSGKTLAQTRDELDHLLKEFTSMGSPIFELPEVDKLRQSIIRQMVQCYREIDAGKKKMDELEEVFRGGGGEVIAGIPMHALVDDCHRMGAFEPSSMALPPDGVFLPRPRIDEDEDEDDDVDIDLMTGMPEGVEE